MKQKGWLLACIIALIFMLPGNSVSAQKNKKDAPTEKSFELSSQMLSTLKFRSIGPAAYSGRISDLAVNPNNTSEYYVATAAGGLWKTDNHGTTFRPIFDRESVYSIGCLALDPNNSNTLWVGTGENNSQRNLSYGDGVYKSTDGGKSFKNMGLKTSSQLAKIIVDPRCSDVVYVASQGQAWGPGGERGLFKTTDGGETWVAVLEIGEYTGVTDLVMDPRNPDVLYAASHQRERRVYSKINGGPESAIYKTTDAGKTWSKLKGGLPGGDVGRIGLAIAPSNPDVVYAVIELPGNSGGTWRTSDRGASWQKQSDKVAGSPQYYNELYVDPNNENTVILMDTRAALSDDGGKTWISIEGRNKHVDNHAIWIDPTDSRHFIMGCDGGVYETYDRAQTWQFKNNLPITQYYHVRTDNDYPFYNVYGGAQDNGSWMGPSRTIRRAIVNDDWTYTIGGDGYLSIPDPDNPDIHYCESQYCGIRRYDRTTGNSINIQPQPTEDEEFTWNWNTPYLISNFNSKTLYLGGNYVFKSTDMGGSWKKISGDMTRGIDQNDLPMMGKMWPPEAVAKNMSTSVFGNIFALAESPMKQGMLYVGTDDGLIWVTENDGADWTKYTKFTGVPEMTFVNYLTPSMHDVSTVYACFDGRKNSSDFTPYLIKSTDKGKTWKSIASNLPSGTVYCIQEDHVDPNILFIGTEWGVWVTIDGGEKWVQLKNGLPTTMVKELTIQRRENDLAVATFGRGFYILDDYTILRQLSKEVAEKEAHIFDIKEALMYNPASNLNYQGGVYFTAPNPQPEVTIQYYIKNGYTTLKSKRIKAQKDALESGAKYPYPTEEELRAEENEVTPKLVFTIYDIDGNIMKKITTGLSKGYKSISWDFSYLSNRGITVIPGEYKVAIDKNDNGVFTRLAEPKSFKIKALPNALGTPDYEERFTFAKNHAKLSADVGVARTKISDMNKRLSFLKTATAGLPVEGDFLIKEIDALQKEVDAVSKVVMGGFGAKTSVSGHLGFAGYATSGAQVNITGAQKEQFNLANERFAGQPAIIAELFDQKLPALERKFVAAGGVL